jgi:hypothetical protein
MQMANPRFVGIRQVRKRRLREVIGQLSHEHLSVLDGFLETYRH